MTHYGGAVTKKGRLGSKPSVGVQMKTALMLERFVRFDLAKANGTPILDEDLARIFGRSQRHLAHIRKTTAYLAKRMELTTGIPGAATDSVEITKQKYQYVLKEMMPTALRVIADSLLAKPTSIQEKKMQVQLSLEVLDREGSFPKISRSDSHVKIEHDFASSDGISKDLLESMDGSAQRDSEDVSILEAIRANVAFTNSDTLSSSKQEKAMKMLEETPLGSEKVQ
jgi:hypothetical protein